jgi:hypothetical protein
MTVTNELNEIDQEQDSAVTLCHGEHRVRVVRFADSHGNIRFNIGTPYNNINLFWKDFEIMVKHFASELIEQGCLNPRLVSQLEECAKNTRGGPNDQTRK